MWVLGHSKGPFWIEGERERERERKKEKERRFEYGQENIYFRIGLVLAILKVVFPDLGLPKQIFFIRETFINRGK